MGEPLALLSEEHSLYTITAETDEATVSLQTGVPFPGMVQGDSYRYFKFVVDTKQSVSISVVSVTVCILILTFLGGRKM